MEKADTPALKNIRPIRLNMDEMSTVSQKKKVRELPKPKPPSAVIPRIAAIKASYKRSAEADFKIGPPLKAQKRNNVGVVEGVLKEQ